MHQIKIHLCPRYRFKTFLQNILGAEPSFGHAYGAIFEIRGPHASPHSTHASLNQMINGIINK